MSGPKDNLNKIHTIANAWETLRPAKSFGGFTLAQFKDKVKPCTDTRAQIDTLNNQLSAATVERDQADVAALDACNLVVNSVRGDSAEGDDGELYEAMGYTRAGARQTGLHRGGRPVVAGAK